MPPERKVALDKAGYYFSAMSPERDVALDKMNITPKSFIEIKKEDILYYVQTAVGLN